MSNLPVKPVQQRDIATKVSEPIGATPELGKSSAATADDALKVSVPRTQSKVASTNDPGPVLDSLLRGLRSSGDVGAAHGGLDAARVFGLLDDDDGDTSK